MADRAYVPNREGLHQLMLSPQMRAVLHAVAEKGKAHAVSISPRSDREHQHYADSFQISDATVLVAEGTRAAARLENTSPQNLAVEFGNQATNGNGHHVLARTLDFLERGT